MFDPDEERVVVDDYLECLAIEDFTATLELGRDRGRTPDPTESQKKNLEKLANKLYQSTPKVKKGEEEAEDVLDFDFLDTTRVMLFDSKVQKKSKLRNHILYFCTYINAHLYCCCCRSKFVFSSAFELSTYVFIQRCNCHHFFSNE
jgi:hypothetical protein